MTSKTLKIFMHAVDGTGKKIISKYKKTTIYYQLPRSHQRCNWPWPGGRKKRSQG